MFLMSGVVVIDKEPVKTNRHLIFEYYIFLFAIHCLVSPLYQIHRKVNNEMNQNPPSSLCLWFTQFVQSIKSHISHISVTLYGTLVMNHILYFISSFFLLLNHILVWEICLKRTQHLQGNYTAD